MSESASSDGTGGGMRWLLLEGNRLLIAGGLVGAIAIATISVLWTFGAAAALPRSPMNFVYSSLITGNMTLLTIVLSINQLVLSRELGAPGTLSERVEETISYRSEVEETTGAAVAPQSPTAFVRYLHERVGEEADAAEAAATDADEEVRGRLGSVADSLRADVRAVVRTLKGGDVSIFTVVGEMLSTTHAEQLDAIGRLRADRGDSISEDLSEHLDRIEDALYQIHVARNYFKTIYVQKELAYLSRALLYVGVPAIVAGGLSLLVYNAGTVAPGPTSLYAALVIVTVPLGFAPLAVLFAFVLRLAWVAQQTATIPPFSPDVDYHP